MRKKHRKCCIWSGNSEGGRRREERKCGVGDEWEERGSYEKGEGKETESEEETKVGGRHFLHDVVERENRKVIWEYVKNKELIW